MSRVQHFFDQATSNFTYGVSDAETGLVVIIDAGSTLITHQADWAPELPPINTSGRLSLKVPTNAFGGAALDRFAIKE